LFNGVITTATAALKGFGRTLAILALGILANISYLFFEYSLVFGAFGFPELGVYGTALATLIVRLVSVAVLFVLLHRWFKVRLIVFRLTAKRLSSMKQLVKISYPSVGEGMIYNFSQLAVVAFVSSLGTAAVLTRSFSLTITSFLTVIGFVVAQGNEILVGYDCGASDYVRAAGRARKTALWTGAFSILCASGIYLYSDLLIGLFTDEDELREAIRDVLFLAIFLAPFQTSNQILFGALKAVGDVNRPVIANLILTFFVALPGAYAAIMLLNLGVIGLWYVYLVHEALRFLILWGLWESKTWTRYKVLNGE
ncbi:MAG: MATE family efflux transporter, partial [Verrucomicrobiota bacterium]